MKRFLTQPQRDALDRLLRAGGVVFVNAKKNGFEQLRAQDAITLMIGRLAELEDGTLQLSPLGRRLTCSEFPADVRERALEWSVNQGTEYP